MATRSPGSRPTRCSAPAMRATRSCSSRHVRRMPPSTTAVSFPRIKAARRSPIVTCMCASGSTIGRGRALLDPSRHVAADLAVLPRSAVAVAVEKHAHGEGAESGQRCVRHHDHRRVADKVHRQHDRDDTVDTAARHAGVEPPHVVADLLDAGDVVAIVARRASFPAVDRERPDEADVAHPFGELTLHFGKRCVIDCRAETEPARQPAAGKNGRDRDDDGGGAEDSSNGRHASPFTLRVRAIIHSAHAMPTTPRRVFISYAQEDGHVFARDLSVQLSAAGHLPWRDKEQLTAQGGVRWVRELTQQLLSADVVVVLLTPRANDSQYVEGEWTKA